MQKNYVVIIDYFDIFVNRLQKVFRNSEGPLEHRVYNKKM